MTLDPHVSVWTAQGGYAVEYELPPPAKKPGEETTPVGESGLAVFTMLVPAMLFVTEVIKAWEGPKEDKPDKVSDIVGKKKPKER